MRILGRKGSGTLCGLILSILMVAACRGGDLSDIVVTASVPQDGVYSGDKAEIGLRAFTIHESLKDFRLESFDPDNGKRLLAESHNIGKKTWDSTIVWTAPMLANDSVKVSLKLWANDTDGHEQSFSYPILVVWSDKPLAEASGLVLYSAGFGSSDALSLGRGEVIDAKTAEESLVDVYIDSECNWRTKTDVQFSLVQGFDYAHSTRRGLEATIRSMRRSTMLASPQAADVILLSRWKASTEKEEEYLEPWGALLVTAVVKEDGYTRFIVNYKAL